jgi:phosphoglycerate dehydrogenase-like enzyme
MNEANRLLVLTEDAETYRNLIRDLQLPGLDVAAVDTTDEARNHIRQCNIILGAPAKIARVLDEAEQLQWVQSSWAGVNELVQPTMRRDYLLTGVKGLYSPMMSEYVFGYILALERHMFTIHAAQRKRQWTPLPYQTLNNRIMGICGLGSIGCHIAETACHFGMKVWGYKKVYGNFPEVDRLFTEEGFEDFLASPEYVVIALPETPATRHLFNEHTLALLNKEAILINIGRGSVVSESALIEALHNNRIRGAVLDVFEEEPLPEDSPLWAFPNVLITPHISAVSFPQDIVQIFAENYRRFVADEPLRYIIDFTIGY